MDKKLTCDNCIYGCYEDVGDEEIQRCEYPDFPPCNYEDEELLIDELEDEYIQHFDND